VSILCFLIAKPLLYISWFQNKKEPYGIQNVQDTLIKFSFIVLVFVLLRNFTPCWVLWFIIWRLAEILVYQSSTLFNGPIVNLPRSIVLFLINFSEVIIIYAILYLSQGAIGYCKFNEIQKPFEALYFSLVKISTTGFGDITPINCCGKFLTFSEIVIGILLLVIFFGLLIRSKSKDRFLCLDCKNVDNKFLTCKAFPNGIPRDIFLNKIKHDHIIKGQTGKYLFESKELP